MRRSLPFLLSLVVAVAAGCMEMDAFLANEEPLSEYVLPGNTIPEARIEHVTFASGDAELHGYWVSSNGRRPGLTILYFHGNKHHLDEYWDRVMLLEQLGANVFIFDYQGFGRSTGAFSEKALLQDARAALDFVLSRPGVRADSVGFYGFSLGNVASIHLAADVMDPAFLVSEAPFASVAALEQGALQLALPAGWLTTGAFDNAARIPSIDTPLLLLHGTDDDFVRWRDNGRVVYERAPEPKRLVLVDGAGHSDIPDVFGEAEYVSLLRSWIDGVTRPGG